MWDNWSAQQLFDLYAQMLGIALPITFLFGCCNVLTSIVVNAFFNGKLKFGGRF